MDVAFAFNYIISTLTTTVCQERAVLIPFKVRLAWHSCFADMLMILRLLFDSTGEVPYLADPRGFNHTAMEARCEMAQEHREDQV